MKKQLLTLFACALTGVAFSQTIPNGNFENWSTKSFEDPLYWACSNDETHSNGYVANNAEKTTDAKSGSFAIKLSTVTNGVDTAGGYFADGNPGNPPQGGMPYNQIPTGFKCWHKYNIMPGDTGLILVQFKKNGLMIGFYLYKIFGTQNNYTLFAPTFSPALTQAPDTVVFAATTCNFMGATKKFIPGSTVYMDSIAFTGVSSQPANFNGDFELWQTVTRESLVGWNCRGTVKTTDKYKGTYAVELITNPPGFGNNQVNVGNFSNANNNNNNSGPPSGGSPFSNQTDTLVFYYKYLPANFPSYTDSAEVNMSFSKNGSWIDGRGMRLSPAIGTFQKVEIPFTLSQIPDTVLLNANSSKYPPQNSYIGSDLIIDQLYFKSQKIPVSIFSLPASGCKGVPIQLTDNSANMPTSWIWITTGSTPTNSSTQQNPVVTYTNTGTFNVSLQAKDSFGSGAYVTHSIVIYNNPVVTASSATVCGANSATITASGASTYTWNNGNNGASINVVPSSTTTYTVVGENTFGCENFATGTVFVPVAPTPDICLVTVDSTSTNNIIYWDKTLYSNVDSFLIYREVSTGTYSCIGAVSKDSLSRFVDVARNIGPANGDPNLGSYRYKLQIRDTCGAYGPLGKYHNTVYIIDNHTGSFSWNTYDVEGQVNSPVNNFYLLRDDNNTNNYISLGSVSGSQTSLSDANYGTYQFIANWRVQASGFNCTPTFRYGNNGTQAAIVKSKSNISNNRTTGIANNNIVLGVHPNPSNGIFTITLAVIHATADVYDLTGKKVAVFNLEGNISQIDLSDLSNGTYFLNVKTEKGVYHQKINKTN